MHNKHKSGKYLFSDLFTFATKWSYKNPYRKHGPTTGPTVEIRLPFNSKFGCSHPQHRHRTVELLWSYQQKNNNKAGRPKYRKKRLQLALHTGFPNPQILFFELLVKSIGSPESVARIGTWNGSLILSQLSKLLTYF